MDIKQLNEELSKYLFQEKLHQGGTGDKPCLTIRRFLGGEGISDFLGWALDPSEIEEVNEKTMIIDHLEWGLEGKTYENLPKGFGYLDVMGLKDFSQLQSLKNLDIKKRIKITGYGTEGNRDFDLSWLPSDFSGVLDLQAMNIKTLKGCPQNITELYLHGIAGENITGLTSLEGCPQNLKVLHIEDCVDLISLCGISQNIGTLELLDNPKLTTWEGVQINSIKDYKASGNGKLTIRTAPEVIKQLINDKKQIKLNKQQDHQLSSEELKEKEQAIKQEFPQAVKYKRAHGFKLQVNFPNAGDSDSIVERAQELANNVGATLEVTAHPNYGFLIINFFI